MDANKNKFLALYEPIHEPFSRFCQARSYGVMEAEDLISESVLRALEKLSQLKSEEAFLSFMFSIAKNILAGQLRRKKFKGFFREKEFLEIPSNGLDAETRLDIQVLYKALNLLPDAQKEALTLFEISGFSIREISVIQNSGESAVKQRLKRGREKLAHILGASQMEKEPIEKRSSILLSVFL